MFVLGFFTCWCNVIAQCVLLFGLAPAGKCFFTTSDNQSLSNITPRRLFSALLQAEPELSSQSHRALQSLRLVETCPTCAICGRKSRVRIVLTVCLSSCFVGDCRLFGADEQGRSKETHDSHSCSPHSRSKRRRICGGVGEKVWGIR